MSTDSNDVEQISVVYSEEKAPTMNIPNNLTESLLQSSVSQKYHKLDKKPKCKGSGYVFVGLLGIFLAILIVGLIVIVPTYFSIKASIPHTGFDYIIVGGGSAGSTLAARLSSNPQNRVLLLEAGGPTQASVGGKDFVITRMCKECDETEPTKTQLTRFDVPGLWFTIPWSLYRGYTWNYGEVAIARALGGCGILNAMIYMRAVPQDLEIWKSQFGVGGWDWNSTLNLFKRTEGNMQASVDAGYHSTTGEMGVSDPNVQDPAFQMFRDSCFAAGMSPNSDFNGRNRDGVGPYPFNIRNGIRDTPLNSLLAPAMKRNNLVVRTFASVERVLFDEDKRAIGVRYVQKAVGGIKTIVEVMSRKEVILSAGALNTPKILLQSGVGPEADLKALGIDVVANVPGVGKNLHDHMSINLIYEWKNHTYQSQYAYGLGSENQYSWDQSGILATAGLTGGAFMQSPWTQNNLSDIQWTVNPRNVQTNESPALSISITQNRPTTRGSLTLKDSNPANPPIISKIFPQTENDLKSMIWGLRQARNLKNFDPFRSNLGAEVTPGAQIQTDQEISDYLRSQTVLGNHWVGSAMMGHLENPNVVVDSELKVRGVKNLRVADGSVMPFITNGNTHATIIMIGEKAAELIMSEK